MCDAAGDADPPPRNLPSQGLLVSVSILKPEFHSGHRARRPRSSWHHICVAEGQVERSVAGGAHNVQLSTAKGAREPAKSRAIDTAEATRYSRRSHSIGTIQKWHVRAGSAPPLALDPPQTPSIVGRRLIEHLFVSEGGLQALTLIVPDRHGWISPRPEKPVSPGQDAATEFPAPTGAGGPTRVVVVRLDACAR